LQQICPRHNRKHFRYFSFIILVCKGPVEGIQNRSQTKNPEGNNKLQKVAFKIFSLSIFIICFYGVDEGVQYRLQTNNQDEGPTVKTKKNEFI
jgi:hypothetical protein